MIDTPLPFAEAVAKVFGIKKIESQPRSTIQPKEDSMKTTQEVLSFAPSSDKPGAWLKLKVKDEKGQERDAYLKDQALVALVKQPGRYEFEKQKQGQYWEITGVRFLGGAGAAPSGGTGGSVARSPGVADVNVIIQNKSIISQVAIKAAVELVGKAIDNGAFKNGDAFDFSSAADASMNLASSLMMSAGEFVKGKAEPKPGTRTEEGRTYEPVEGA